MSAIETRYGCPYCPQHVNECNDYRLNINLPNFIGNLRIEDFLDLVSLVEKFFDHVDVTDEKKVKLVSYKLKSWVFVWWDQVQHERKLMGKMSISSWNQMKKKLMQSFLSTNYEQLLYQYYH